MYISSHFILWLLNQDPLEPGCIPAYAYCVTPTNTLILTGIFITHTTYFILLEGSFFYFVFLLRGKLHSILKTAQGSLPGRMSIRPEAVRQVSFLSLPLSECCWTNQSLSRPEFLIWEETEHDCQDHSNSKVPWGSGALEERSYKTRLPPWLATAGSIQAILNPSRESIPYLSRRLLWAVQERAQWGERTNHSCSTAGYRQWQVAAVKKDDLGTSGAPWQTNLNSEGAGDTPDAMLSPYLWMHS